MNGNTLKISFLGIVITFCLILLGLVGLCVAGKIPIDILEKIITILGIPTLFGMIAQAFIHADFNHDGIPDAQQIIGGNNEKIVNPSVPINPIDPVHPIIITGTGSTPTGNPGASGGTEPTSTQTH